MKISLQFISHKLHRIMLLKTIRISNKNKNQFTVYQSQVTWNNDIKKY